MYAIKLKNWHALSHEQYYSKHHFLDICQCASNLCEFLSTCKKWGHFTYSFWRYGWLKNTAIWLAEHILAHVSVTNTFTNIGIKGALSGLRQFLTTESPLKMMKNAFYFTSNALCVLKMFKFLSWIFGHDIKTAWLKRSG